MQSQEEIANKLLEIFPQLKKEEAHTLAFSRDPFSVLVTRVLNNNIERPYSDIKLFKNQINYRKIEKEYNYKEVMQNKNLSSLKKTYNNPEIFEIASANIKNAIADFREKAKENYERMKLIMHSNGYCIRTTRHLYLSDLDNLRSKAEQLNKQAAMLLIRLAVINDQEIDLHGFYVKEALLFLDDLYLYSNFNKIGLITGRKTKSQKIRPAVEEWLKKNGFNFYEDGPKIYAIQKNI